MNHKSSPCTNMAGHNYATCINVWIAKSVGCQSFWSNYTGIPVCSDIDQYNSYTSEYDRVIGMEKNELLATTGCLRPCKYMEYSVMRSIKHSSKLTPDVDLFQLADSPINTVAPNQTNITIMFSSSSVTVEKEEKAFTFGSFVADVGGVLGLFIGFSFISLWEFSFVCLCKLYSTLKK